MTKSSALKLQPNKRRWFRFRLRTLLVLLTLFCLWLGWYMVQVHTQRRVVAVLAKYNAEIRYGAFYVYPPWTQILPRSLRGWLNVTLPSNDLRRVSQVTIQSANLKEYDLAVLADLPYLTYLSLSGPAATDASLEHVKNLKQLRCLKLMDSNVSDEGLRCVSGLKSLEFLILDGTPVTGAGMSHLRGLEKIDELYLQGTNVTSACLEDLAAIKSLRVLRLENTRVCGEGLVDLAKMPKLEIVSLQGTPTSDADLKFLKQIPSHVLLYLARTKVTDETAKQLPNAYDRRVQSIVAPASP